MRLALSSCCVLAVACTMLASPPADAQLREQGLGLVPVESTDGAVFPIHLGDGVTMGPSGCRRERAPAPARDETIEAESLALATGEYVEVDGRQGWLLRSAGSVPLTFDVPRAGSYTLGATLFTLEFPTGEVPGARLTLDGTELDLANLMFGADGVSGTVDLSEGEHVLAVETLAPHLPIAVDAFTVVEHWSDPFVEDFEQPVRQQIGSAQALDPFLDRDERAYYRLMSGGIRLALLRVGCDGVAIVAEINLNDQVRADLGLDELPGELEGGATGRLGESYCGWFDNLGLLCLTPADDPDALPGVDVRLDLDTFIGSLETDVASRDLPVPAPSDNPELYLHRLGILASLPDGRILATAALIERERDETDPDRPAYRGVNDYRWLVAIDGDGRMTFVTAPTRVDRLPESGLIPAGLLAVDAGAAVLDHDNELVWIRGLATNRLQWWGPARYDRLYSGAWWVLPFDLTPGQVGWVDPSLELTSATRVDPDDRAPQNSVGPAFWALTETDGAPVLGIRTWFEDTERYGDAFYRVRLDPDAADLDHDRLSATDEAALGRSDLNADEDGDGVPDGLEADWRGTDPNVDDLEVRLADPEALHFDSGLIRRRVSGTLSRQHFEAGTYLCFYEGCYDRAGTLFSFDAPQAFTTEDGDHIVYDDGDTVWREQPSTGERTSLGSSSAVRAALGDPGRSFEMVPGAFDTVAAYHGASTERIVVFGPNDPPRVVFDRDAILCDAGIGCAPDGADEGTLPIDPGILPQTWVSGYDVATDHVMVTLKTRADTWVLAVPLSGGAPHVALYGGELPAIARSIDAVLDPDLNETQRTWFWSALEPWDSVAMRDGSTLLRFVDGGGWFVDPSWHAEVRLLGSGVVPGGPLGASVIAGGWDGAFLEYMNGELGESVPMEPVIEPGDIVRIAAPPGSSEAAIDRIGRRGAARPLYGLVDLNDPLGAGAGPDGRWCAVFASPEPLLVEMGNLFDADTTLPGTGLSGGELRDCGYDLAGNVIAIADAPANITRWTRDGDELVLDTEVLLEGSAELESVERLPDGRWLVQRRGDVALCVDLDSADVAETSVELRAATLLDDGRLFVVDTDWGAHLTTPTALCSGQEPGAAFATLDVVLSPGRRLPIAARPDGLVLFQDERFVSSIDMVEGRQVPISFLGDIAGRPDLTALVRAPGGTWTDPWLDDVDPDDGTAPDGEGSGDDAGGGGSKRGCAAADSSPAPWWAAGAGLGIAVWRRRRVRVR